MFLMENNIIIELIRYFNQLSQFNENLPKVPQFKEIRWFSLFYSVSYIIENKECIHFNLYDTIEQQFEWQYILSILNTLDFFIQSLEKDSASIADVFPNYQKTLNQLKSINEIYPKDQNSNTCEETLNALLGRFSSTVKLPIPTLAFFLTGEGLRNIYQSKDDEMIIASEVALIAFDEYIKNNLEKNKLYKFFEIILKYPNDTSLISQITTYDSFIFWKHILNGELRGIEKILAKIAIEILTIPCSETACERAFSHLGDILMNDKRNLEYEMLNSLLIIRMNAIFLKQDANSSHDFLNHDFDQIIKSDSEKEKLEYEDEPLIYF